MSEKPNPADQFRQALSGAMKAVAADSELEVVFNADKPGLAGKLARLPMPRHDLPDAQVEAIRGLSDSMALRLRHHDARVHAAHQPPSGEARDIFNAIEQARVEGLGATQMQGIAANLSNLIKDRCRDDGLFQARTVDDIPLGAALALMVRERVTGTPPPVEAQAAIDLVRVNIEDKGGSTLDRLADVIDDQSAFSALIRNLLTDLDILEDDGQKPEEQNQDTEDQEDDKQDQQGEDGDGSGDDQSASDSVPDEEADTDSGDEDGDSQQAGEVGIDDTPTQSFGDEREEGMTPFRPNTPLSQLSPDFDYQTYTTAFDEIVLAEDLCDADELARLRNYLDQQLIHLQGAVTKLANRLQRRLMAQQNRAWEFDLEEGLLDSGRLARIVVSPQHPLSYKWEQETDFRDTVVTLLIDNSGSMRGRPISIAAICADILARTLERCGVKVEILGFTTRAWKGGQSRDQWLKEGKPTHPGRLNDLRHIIFKTADAPWRRTRRNLGLMMREGLLKENIDGEGLLWAHHRLVNRPEERRILMVISDGAPVDDSTLSVNSGSYLERHLRQVIGWIEKASPVELIAIGIGHDVTRYYARAVTIMDAEQLGGAMVEQLAALFDEDTPAKRRRRK
ncbi:MAG: cobaltochelatase subunit CobT [Pseudomonadota bacterium]